VIATRRGSVHVEGADERADLREGQAIQFAAAGSSSVDLPAEAPARGGAPLELAAMQAPSSGPTPPPPGGGAVVGAGNCPFQICLQGKVTIDKDGKVFLDVDVPGVRIELQGPAIAAAVRAGTIKDGSRISVGGQVLKKADPKTNTGLVLGVQAIGPPSPNPNNVLTILGPVTKDADGQYWVEQTLTGLRFKINPGSDCGSLAPWITNGKKTPPRDSSVDGAVQPPPKGNPFPTINASQCIEGTITVEGQAPNQQVFITDQNTGVKTQLKMDPNNPNDPGTKLFAAAGLQNLQRNKSVVVVCGYITKTANPIANTGMELAPASVRYARTKPCKPKSITGTITKDKDGKYYIDNPVTGERYEIKPDDNLKKDLDQQIQKQDNQTKAKLPLDSITIYGIIRPPKAGEDYPVIEKPKTVAAAIQPAAGSHWVRMVVLTEIGAAGLSIGLVGTLATSAGAPF